MSFTALLNSLKHKPGATGAKASSSSPKSSSRPLGSSQEKIPFNAIPKDYKPAPLDPAVQRLKELRRLEKEKEAAEKSKRKPASASTTRKRSTPSASRAPRTTSTGTPWDIQAAEQPKFQRRSASPVKRLTFSELMNQANQKTKSLKESRDTPPPQNQEQYVSKTKREPKSAILRRKAQPQASSVSAARSAVPRSSSYAPKKPVMRPTQPKPLARPSAKLLASLAAKKKSRAEIYGSVNGEGDNYRRSRYDDEEDSYGSDEFVVDDEEADVEEDVGYNRDEIWKMFGRNRQQYVDYDDDLSDMEATGEEILREESRAEKRARMEEKAEADAERRRVEEKRRRLGRK